MILKKEITVEFQRDDIQYQLEVDNHGVITVRGFNSFVHGFTIEDLEQALALLKSEVKS